MIALSVCESCRLGRKFWLVEASFQMFICEIIVGTVIGTQMGADGSFPTVSRQRWWG